MKRSGGRRVGDKRPRTPKEWGAWLAAEVRKKHAELAPQLPDVDPEDLDLILTSLLRPPAIPRRFLLREVSPGVYVP